MFSKYFESLSLAGTKGARAEIFVLKFNNFEIIKMSDLPRVVAESDVGSKSILEVWRKNKKIKIEVILGELPGEVVTERNKKELENLEKNIELLGISISNNLNGVEVTEIKNENSNLEVGDVISEINREPVTDTTNFNKLVIDLEKTGRSSLLLKIIRNDEQLWVTIKFNN